MNRHLLILMLLFCGVLYAQDKQELERRVNREELPKDALTYLQPAEAKVKRIKYYFETDGDHQSYEAKFRYDKLKYSVEFDVNGQLEDIEVDSKLRHSSQEIQDDITKWLDSNYPKWRIEKFQLQYTDNDKGDLLIKMLNGMSLPDPWFELIVTVKLNGKVTSFELLFDSSGSFINKREVVRRSYDFVLF